MSETHSSAPRGSAVAISEAARPTVRSLIAKLGSDDGVVRIRARRQLMAYKARAVRPLIKALSDDRQWVRWEAAKALSQIGDQKSIQALLKALSDKEFDVRWLAALVEDPDSRWVREGIHHVLHGMNKRGLGQVPRPVLAALEGSEPALSVPPEARTAQNTLKKN